MNWQRGDRVSLVLPDHSQPIGLGSKKITVLGTVDEVDPGGVRVQLDIRLNGSQSVYATHRELKKAAE